MNRDTVAGRAHRLLEGGMPEYSTVHRDRRLDSFDPVGNPNGYIGLCIAENGLMWDHLAPWLSGSHQLDPSVAGYGDMTGSEALRRSVADIFERHVFHRAVDPDSVVTMAGAGAVLEALFRGLADPGEGVLVPTPSYAGFWPDVETRNDLQIVEVPRFPDSGYRLTIDQLDRALNESSVPIRALLYTNPDNPLGTVAAAAEVEELLEWAAARSIHFVSDEIYALSVFGDGEFASAGRTALGDRVHVVWGASKDFGMSGLRCGVLVSENQTVLQMMSAQSMWSSVSTHTQFVLADMWSDAGFVERFIETNQERLGHRYERLATRLDAAGIDHHPIEAGFFTLVDLRAHLAEPTWEAETGLWRALVDEANVNITPGAACRSSEPGLFRLCFASVSDEALDEGISRLARHLS